MGVMAAVVALAGALPKGARLVFKRSMCCFVKDDRLVAVAVISMVFVAVIVVVLFVCK